MRNCGCSLSASLHFDRRSSREAFIARCCNILVEQPKYIESLIKIIDSENFPLSIQQVALQAVKAICRNVNNKTKVISKEIVKSLLKIALTSLDSHLIQKYDVEIRKMSVICLTTLGGIYDRKMYIPGETRENDKVRKILIENGGLVALIYIHKKALEQELRDIPAQFLENLQLTDFEYQGQLLQMWRHRNNSEGIPGCDARPLLKDYATQLNQPQMVTDENNPNQRYLKLSNDFALAKPLHAQSPKCNVFILKSSNNQTVQPPQAASIANRINSKGKFMSSHQPRSLTKASSKSDIVASYYRDRINPSMNIFSMEPYNRVFNLEEFQSYMTDYIARRRVEVQKREEEEKRRKESEIQEQQKQQEQKAKLVQERKQIFEEMQRKKEERLRLDMQLKKREEEKYQSEADNNRIKQQEIFSNRHIRSQSHQNELAPCSARRTQIDTQRFSQQDKKMLKMPTLNSPPSTDRKYKNLSNLKQINQKIFDCGGAANAQPQKRMNFTQYQITKQNTADALQETRPILLNREERKLEGYLPLKMSSQPPQDTEAHKASHQQNILIEENPMKRNESEENYAASNNLIANQASSNNLSSDPGTATNLPDGKAGNMASQARSKQSEVILMVRTNNKHIEKIL